MEDIGPPDLSAPPAPTRDLLSPHRGGVRGEAAPRLGRDPRRRAGQGPEHGAPPGGGPAHRRADPRAPTGDSGGDPGAATRAEVPGERLAGELPAGEVMRVDCSREAERRVDPP